MKRSRSHNHLSCFILMLALTVQALMPLGFMPDGNANGKFALVICTGMGEKTVYVDADQMPFAPDEAPLQRQAASECPFAPHVTYSFSYPGIRIPAPHIEKAPRLLPAQQIAKLHITAKPWQSQAPPAHA